MKKRIGVAVLAAAVVALAAGCGGGRGWGRHPEDYVKPAIAVMKFENRASFAMGWNLGDGMREILVDRLMKTGRYTVVERQEIDSVTREIEFQQSGSTRPQGKVAAGRIKNCQYLIKGVVTDFGHVSASAGGTTLWNWDFLGGSNRAVMSIILYVVDVESGEIIASESIEESVKASDTSVKAAYAGVSFGGTTFYQTPLGRATAKVIERAVSRITKAIADHPWEPLIAQVQPDGTVILNGGEDHRLKRGAEFDVLEAGTPILDPVTGDAIGRHPGRIVGRIIVNEIRPRYSLATIVVGRAADFRPGLACKASG
jgi:curli biogenesis system outer membrane secretion channel CsgG